MILKNIKDEEIDLSKSSLSNDHVNTKGTYAEFLVEQLNYNLEKVGNDTLYAFK